MNYEEMHNRRYNVLLDYCRKFIPNSDSKVLEIGASYFTTLIAKTFPNLEVMGLEEHRDYFVDFPLDKDRYIAFDLNKSQFKDLWIDLKKYDAIIYAEVIEHLFCPPECSLQFLADNLSPGGVIICQTPNGLSLEKRLRMLAGFPPFDRKGAEHYREFSKEELFEAGHIVGLTIEHHEYHDYFGVRGGLARKIAGVMLHTAGYFLPFLRRGQTIVYRKNK